MAGTTLPKRQNLSYNAVISWNREQPTQQHATSPDPSRSRELFLFI